MALGQLSLPERPKLRICSNDERLEILILYMPKRSYNNTNKISNALSQCEMMETSQKIGIYAHIRPQHHQGLQIKYENWQNALLKNGIETQLHISQLTPFSALKNAISVIWQNHSIIILRLDLLFFFYVIPLTISVLRKTTVIVELPDPFQTVMKRYQNINTINAWAKWTLMSIILYLMRVLPFHIAAYADNDDEFFRHKKSKYKIISNGVDFDLFPTVTNSCSDFKDTNITVVCIANVAVAHGIDRLINGIPGTNVQLKIIGSGQAIPSLKKLADQRGVSDQVSFLKPMIGVELTKAIEGAHVGLTALGCHREGLFQASPLKTREYAARGLPTFGSYLDTALSDNGEFPFFHVPADETPLDVQSLCKFLRKQPKPIEIRERGRLCFDVDVTAKQLIAFARIGKM